ncbi:hypothetical protein VSR01_10560 [Actinacidiphila sp. DG2A-62]|uniref:hypothetical protein n=1 Tax=Actinacidiphila sp. DG2A-62 TaxID=3108821 RepID=UPI002DBD3048|nr:hypothetical protein [Actinacidiphila sp. DG2A-62]MEC3993959.1 hypothetical protein [Actinacidiphila sp. DG2A-62]
MSDLAVRVVLALLLATALLGMLVYLVAPWARRRAAAVRARLTELRATEPQRPDPRELAAGAARLTAAAHGRHAARIPHQRTHGGA